MAKIRGRVMSSLSIYLAANQVLSLSRDRFRADAIAEELTNPTPKNQLSEVEKHLIDVGQEFLAKPMIKKRTRQTIEQVRNMIDAYRFKPKTIKISS